MGEYDDLFVAINELWKSRIDGYGSTGCGVFKQGIQN